MRRKAMMAAVVLGLAGGLAGSPTAQQADPPHAWVFGTWTGGIFPAGETEGARCTGSPAVIFTRDVVLRASPFDAVYRQRLVETVSGGPEALEFRFAPAPPQASAFGARLPADFGFGCPAGPNALRVERRGPNEIAFPNCGEFPLPLRRCTGP